MGFAGSGSQSQRRQSGERIGRGFRRTTTADLLGKYSYLWVDRANTLGRARVPPKLSRVWAARGFRRQTACCFDCIIAVVDNRGVLLTRQAVRTHLAAMPNEPLPNSNGPRKAVRCLFPTHALCCIQRRKSPARARLERLHNGGGKVRCFGEPETNCRLPGQAARGEEKACVGRSA
jgi:hypothetical protein